MSKPPKDDQYSEEETKRRAEEALRGAFRTPPVRVKGAPVGNDKRADQKD